MGLIDIPCSVGLVGSRFQVRAGRRLEGQGSRVYHDMMALDGSLDHL